MLRNNFIRSLVTRKITGIRFFHLSTDLEKFDQKLINQMVTLLRILIS